MSDLRKRLRDLQDHDSTSGQLNYHIFRDAANEIARLHGDAAEIPDTDLVKRAREYARNMGGPPEDYLVWQLADEIERLRTALRLVVESIEDYERVNNLAPSPGRKHCWDSVAHAHDVLGDKP